MSSSYGIVVIDARYVISGAIGIRSGKDSRRSGADIGVVCDSVGAEYRLRVVCNSHGIDSVRPVRKLEFGDRLIRIVCGDMESEMISASVPSSGSRSYPVQYALY